MRKIHVILVTVAVMVFTVSLVFGPSGAVSQKASKPAATTGIPDDVMKIFQNCCMKCHADGGSGMAMSMVNFSGWDKYSAAKQAKKATAICKEVTGGSMPPTGFKSANPDRVPTATQVATICQWATSLNPPKNK